MQAKRKLTALLLSLCSIVDRRVIYSFRKIDTVYVIWPGNFLFENSPAFLRSTANSIKTTPQLHLNSTFVVYHKGVPNRRDTTGNAVLALAAKIKKEVHK